MEAKRTQSPANKVAEMVSVSSHHRLASSHQRPRSRHQNSTLPFSGLDAGEKNAVSSTLSTHAVSSILSKNTVCPNQGPPPRENLLVDSSSSSLLLSSQGLSDTNVYAPEMRARLGTTECFCEVVGRFARDDFARYQHRSGTITNEGVRWFWGCGRRVLT